MTPIRTAVVGVGVQGERHAQKLAALPGSDLVKVYDADAERAARVASELGADVASEIDELIGDVEAVAIATPTSTHFDITRRFLEKGIHVLLEKPIATTMDEAIGLVEVAEANDIVFQVGHLERFNPAVIALVERRDQ